MNVLLDTQERPMAVFVCSEIMSIRALNVALERGLRVLKIWHSQKRCLSVSLTRHAAPNDQVWV